jgi:hypothetical protein
MFKHFGSVIVFTLLLSLVLTNTTSGNSTTTTYSYSYNSSSSGSNPNLTPLSFSSLVSNITNNSLLPSFNIPNLETPNFVSTVSNPGSTTYTTTTYSSSNSSGSPSSPVTPTTRPVPVPSTSIYGFSLPWTSSTPSTS